MREGSLARSGAVRWLRDARATLRRRPMLVDGILAAIVLALGVFAVSELQNRSTGELLVASAGVIGSAAAMVWRRRFPLWSATGAAALLQISTDAFVAGTIGVLVALYSATAHGRGKWHIPTVAVLAVATMGTFVGRTGLLADEPDVIQAVLIGSAFAWAIPIVLGILVRSTRERHRRFVLDAEQSARRAVFDERVRIARELHDVVAHHVSLMGVQAGAARMVIGADDEQAARALAAIEESSRHAVTELRHMLGALRSDGAPESATPQPGLDQVPDLVEKAGRSSLAVEGERRPVPRTVDVSAYRVVQEALTNSIKHSGGATTQVRLRYQPATLEIEVLDNGTTTPKLMTGIGGHGLIGMRERVALHGGELHAGPRPGGGFGVHAVFPLDGVPA